MSEEIGVVIEETKLESPVAEKMKVVILDPDAVVRIETEEPKVVKGVKSPPAFKTWAEREKYLMENPEER